MKLRLVKESIFPDYIEVKWKYFPFWLKFRGLGYIKNDEEALKCFEKVLKHEKVLKNGDYKKIVKEDEI